MNAVHETSARILVVDDHAQARQSMADILTHCGHHVTCCASAVEALARLDELEVDVIITDLRMPGMSGLEFIRTVHERSIDAEMVMVTAHATVASAVEAMRYGAFDFIEKPFDANRLESLVLRAMRDGAAVTQRKATQRELDSKIPLIGSSSVMRQLRQRIRQIAATHETVLITGESGTGKEVVARRLHAESQRAAQPLVSLNCPALSPPLMESELFGHERGAFTSADAPRIGRFELADGGTLLLDEITEIELALQAKLLRVLQEKAFERVGASHTRAVDVRVLASTNRDLQHEVSANRFRQDLFYRLNVLNVQIPPLRDRHEDIPELVDYFRRLAADRLQRPPVVFDTAAQDLLVNYHWPGNVRELENVVTRASVLLTDRPVGSEDVVPWLIDVGPARSRGKATSADGEAIRVGMSLQEMERKLIETTLDHFAGHRVKAAQALGIGVRTLTNKLRGYGYAPRTKKFVRLAEAA